MHAAIRERRAVVIANGAKHGKLVKFIRGSNVVDSYQTCGAGSGKSNETFDNATRLKGQLKIFATADSSEDAWRLLNS